MCEQQKKGPAIIPHLPLGAAPFSETAELFSVVSNQRIHVITEKNKDPKVSVFTPEQYPYVNTTISYLNMLADGKLRGQSQSVEPPDPLHDHIFRHYTELGEEVVFPRAIQRGIIDLFTDFNTYYRNLIPILLAIYENTDAQIGTRVAAQYANQTLYAAQLGKVTAENQHHWRLDIANFHQQQRTADGKTEECAAPNFAQAIMKHTTTAALRIIAALPDQPIREYEDEEPETDYAAVLRALISG